MATSTVNRTLSALVNIGATTGSAVENGWCNTFYDPNSQSVRVYGSVNNTTNISTSAVLFTVPTAYKPSAARTFPAIISNADGVTPASVSINTNGEIKQSYSSTTKKIVFVGEYQL